RRRGGRLGKAREQRPADSFRQRLFGYVGHRAGGRQGGVASQAFPPGRVCRRRKVVAGQPHRVEISPVNFCNCDSAANAALDSPAKLWVERVMQIYRIYVVDSDGHSELPPLVVECANDQAAIGQARQVVDGKLVEVWREATRIARLEPE